MKPTLIIVIKARFSTAMKDAVLSTSKRLGECYHGKWHREPIKDQNINIFSHF